MGKWIQCALAATLLVVAFLFWQQRTELRQLRAAQTAAEIPVATSTNIVQSNAEAITTSASNQEAPNPHPSVVEMEYTPTGMAPKPRSSGLELATVRVAPMAEGLLTTLRFTPTTPEPLGIIDIVVRLPVDEPARILSLEPAGAARFTSTAQRVSENGKFAIFHGTFESGEEVEFALVVTEPVTADVRGTAGIGPYDLVISEAGAKAQPKP